MASGATSAGLGHALVVGGSSMLAGLCRMLAATGGRVTVVGRDQQKLARATTNDVRLDALSVNYLDITAVTAALDAAVAARGPITLAVCWIRSWAPQSLLAAADAVAPGGCLFHVLGSQAGNASRAAIDELAAGEHLRYRQVQLGVIAGGAGRRWLTNDEISAGIYAAIVADRPYQLVGTIAP
jgi:hypothetical protein